MPTSGLLLDLEGVLYHGEGAIAGAREAVRALTDRGLAIRFLTNTTTRPRRAIVERLVAMGFDVAESQVFTPVRAAVRYMDERGIRRLHLAADPTLAEDLPRFTLADRDVEAVVMGDLHTGFTWSRLNDLYGMLRGGARLLALHKNRYCRREGELALDLGPFVAALEYAAATEAVVFGKPARAFFASAVADMGLTAAEAVMVGDDIEADIGGAIAAGIAAVQVRTGKYDASDEQSAHLPAARIDSIADLPAWLERHG